MQEKNFLFRGKKIPEKYLEQRNKAKFAADMIDLW